MTNNAKNNSNNETKNYYINVHYAVGEGDDRVVVDEDVPVTEEVYRAFKRPLWAEKKAKERKSRCQIGKDNGKTKRCNGDCSQCDHFRSGSDLSLEGLEEAGDYRAATTQDVAEVAVYNALLENLFDILDEMDPESRYIVQAIMDGQQDKETAAQLGRAASTLSYQKKKLLAELKERLKDFM